MITTNDYLAIKNLIANKVITDIKLVAPDQTNNKYDYNKLQIHLYLTDPEPIENYHNLSNKYVVTFITFTDGKHYHLGQYFKSWTDKAVQPETINNKKIRSIIRILQSRYLTVSEYYVLETTDGDKYKIFAEGICLHYNVISLSSTIDNPLITLGMPITSYDPN